MKTLYIFLFLLVLLSCKEDTPNLYTFVEGTVYDYYSNQPVPNIRIKITENLLFDFKEPPVLSDSLYSDSTGRFSFEFYNKINCSYYVSIFNHADYALVRSEMIAEGDSNVVDLYLKPFINLNLILVNKSKEFDRILVHNHNYAFDSESFTCVDEVQCDTLFHLVPEYSNYFQIRLEQSSPTEIIGPWRSESLKFFAGRNDTCITYFY